VTPTVFATLNPNGSAPAARPHERAAAASTPLNFEEPAWFGEDILGMLHQLGAITLLA
jgi:hypothetical protein